ncbi:hypothetical protein V6N13_042297 [Hibiscus sabdariffa]|uniref:Uncharacterized protein n=1 Tax=Hibiscus sabdariffa TaxID=183260 RepID=A0ABR2DFM2_9ROSI
MVVMTVAPTTSLSGVLFDISDQLFNKKKEYNPSCDIQKHRHDTTTQNKIKLRREPFVKSFESIYMHVHKVLQYMPLPPSKVTDFTGNYAFVHKISNERPFSLIRVIVTLLHRAWVVDISWMPQGGNDPVNWLAKKALRSSCQPLILDFPLPDLLPLLSADMNGASLEQDHRVNLIVVNSEG